MKYDDAHKKKTQKTKYWNNQLGEMVLKVWDKPITPQATRAPEFPVVLLSGVFP